MIMRKTIIMDILESLVKNCQSMTALETKAEIEATFFALRPYLKEKKT